MKLGAADVDDQPASKKPRRVEQIVDDADFADDCYSDSGLPNIAAARDDDDDEPIREPDTTRVRVDEDDREMPDHLLPGDGEDIDSLTSRVWEPLASVH